MRGTFKVAEQLLISRLLSDGFSPSGKTKAGMSFLTLSGLLLLVALGFFVYAAHIWFIKNYAPEIAFSMTGGVILFFSLICALAAYIVREYKKLKVEKIKSTLIHKMEDIFEVANDEIGEPIQENPKTSVLIASLAGFAAGERLF